VDIRDVYPAMDGDVVTISGEIVVGPKGPIRDVVVCLSGSCHEVAEGNLLLPGSRARFVMTTRKGRPTGLLVQCSMRSDD
jgi:hypothetical protein